MNKSRHNNTCDAFRGKDIQLLPVNQTNKQLFAYCFRYNSILEQLAFKLEHTKRLEFINTAYSESFCAFRVRVSLIEHRTHGTDVTWFLCSFVLSVFVIYCPRNTRNSIIKWAKSNKFSSDHCNLIAQSQHNK